MTREFVLIGPPGTGKTEAGITLARGWFGSGAGPGQVAYLGFTRAAAQAAAERITDGEVDDRRMAERFPLFRTIHSLAYRGLLRARQGARVVTPGDMKRFSKESDLEGAYAAQGWEDVSDAYQSVQKGGKTEWDKAQTAYTLSRISATDVESLRRARQHMSKVAMRVVGALDEDVYRAFIKRYEDWKVKDGLVDFTDMLEFALLEMPPIDGCRYVVVDECQDLAPILFKICERLFSAAEQIWWIGDPDQSIYSFCAADAKLFYDRVQRAHATIMLRQTHRFGQEIVDFSNRIIRRVKGRIETDVIGAPGRDHKIWRSGEFKPFAGEGFVLHRHVQGCQKIAQAFIDAGLPFRNERGRDPLGAAIRIQGFETLELLAQGGEVGLGSAARLIEELMPSVVVSNDGADKMRLVVHGGKKKVSAGGANLVRLDTLKELGILTPDGVRVVRERRLGLFKHPADLEYYSRVLRNGYGLDSVGPIVTTEHGVKGRQAQHVTAFSEVGRRCWDDPDTEHRLAYVAATRTRGTLEICSDRKVDWAEVNYEYPIL